MVTKLSTALVKVLDMRPRSKRQINDQGAEVYGGTPRQFSAFI